MCGFRSNPYTAYPKKPHSSDKAEQLVLEPRVSKACVPHHDKSPLPTPMRDSACSKLAPRQLSRVQIQKTSSAGTKLRWSATTPKNEEVSSWNCAKSGLASTFWEASALLAIHGGAPEAGLKESQRASILPPTLLFYVSAWGATCWESNETALSGPKLYRNNIVRTTLPNHAFKLEKLPLRPASKSNTIILQGARLFAKVTVVALKPVQQQVRQAPT